VVSPLTWSKLLCGTCFWPCVWPERCAHVVHRTQTVGTDAAGTAAAGLAPGVGLITRLYLKSDRIPMCNDTLWSFPARISCQMSINAEYIWRSREYIREQV